MPTAAAMAASGAVSKKRCCTRQQLRPLRSRLAKEGQFTGRICRQRNAEHCQSKQQSHRDRDNDKPGINQTGSAKRYATIHEIERAVRKCGPGTRTMHGQTATRRNDELRCSRPATAPITPARRAAQNGCKNRFELNRPSKRRSMAPAPALKNISTAAAMRSTPKITASATAPIPPGFSGPGKVYSTGSPGGFGTFNTFGSAGAVSLAGRMTCRTDLYRYWTGDIHLLAVVRWLRKSQRVLRPGRGHRDQWLQRGQWHRRPAADQ